MVILPFEGETIIMPLFGSLSLLQVHP